MHDQVVLKSIQLTNFRNYQNWEAAFSPGVTLIYGANGIGKTNLLDAIYLSCFGRGYFSSLDKNLIRKGSDFYRIQTEWETGAIRKVAIKKQKGKSKIIEVNRHQIDKLSAFIGRLPVVMIVPDDKELIDGSNEYRRKFVNTTLSQFSTSYLEALGVYHRLLSQRNKYLKHCIEQKRQADRDLLSTFDDQLINPATQIYQQRKTFFEQFSRLFQQYYTEIAGKQDEVDLQYVSQLDNQEDFAQLLRQNRRKDSVLGRTTVGVHRDQVNITLNEQPFKNLGSQGQKKTAVFALKFAQYSYLSNHIGILPILLLDDVFDKLDQNRMHRLIELIDSSSYGQIFLTDTQADRFVKFWVENSRNKSLQLISIEERHVLVLSEEE